MVATAMIVMRGDPYSTPMRWSRPMARLPVPALTYPAPVAANPDETWSRCGDNRFVDRRWRWLADHDFAADRHTRARGTSVLMHHAPCASEQTPGGQNDRSDLRVSSHAPPSEREGCHRQCRIVFNPLRTTSLSWVKGRTAICSPKTHETMQSATSSFDFLHALSGRNFHELVLASTLGFKKVCSAGVLFGPQNSPL